MSVALVALSLLAAFYFRSQVLGGTGFELRADENRLLREPIQAHRGAILDRNGEPIAWTVVTHDLLLDPLSADSSWLVLGRLRRGIPIADATLDSLLAQRRSHPEETLPVVVDLSEAGLSWIDAHRYDLPGIRVEMRAERHQANGGGLARILGTLPAPSVDSFTPFDTMRRESTGIAGLELLHDSTLRGDVGARFMEIDPHGHVVGGFAARSIQAPSAGTDLHLTLDLPLQQFVSSIFPPNRNGAVVAMVPRTGEILALYSHPGVDRGVLSAAGADSTREALESDARRPLVDRAIAGLYTPGATWMIPMALIGLQQGLITPDARMPIPCTGGMSYAGRYSRCWIRAGHGALDLVGAIGHSCKVYFFQLGIWLGIDRLSREGTRLGFSGTTGVDLRGEATGVFPRDAATYEARFGEAPTPDEAMKLAIGEGSIQQTPLSVARLYAALANDDGAIPTPHVVATGGQPVASAVTLGVEAAALHSLRRALMRDSIGGASSTLQTSPWRIYGQSSLALATPDQAPHAWFAGLAGSREGPPEVVITVVVESAEAGTVTAAPLAGRIAEFYLEREHATEVTTAPEP